jgi:pimeloyl-ACP methyl ester carboxylesterase
MQRLIDGISARDQGDRRHPSIIFTHGFPFSSKMWQHQVAALSQSYYCVTYDVRGLGQSAPGDGQYTLEGLVDDLLSVADELKLDRPIAVGLSMGGYIALRAAEKRPESFRGLVLCDTKSAADDDAGKLARAQAIKSINRDGMSSYASYIVSRCFSSDAPDKSPRLFQEALDEVRQQNPLGVKGCLLAMAGRTDTTAFLAQIAIPTLLIVGENDLLTPPALMRSMQNKINGSELSVIPEAGHMAPVENPAAVNRALESFIAKHFPGSR